VLLLQKLNSQHERNWYLKGELVDAGLI